MQTENIRAVVAVYEAFGHGDVGATAAAPAVDESMQFRRSSVTDM